MKTRVQAMQMLVLMQTYLALTYVNVYVKNSYRIRIIVHIFKTSF